MKIYDRDFCGSEDVLQLGGVPQNQPHGAQGPGDAEEAEQNRIGQQRNPEGTSPSGSHANTFENGRASAQVVSSQAFKSEFKKVIAMLSSEHFLNSEVHCLADKSSFSTLASCTVNSIPTKKCIMTALQTTMNCSLMSPIMNAFY